MGVIPEDEVALLKARAAFYKKVIERYSEEIDAGEQKTIPELKALVNPTDFQIQLLKKRFLTELGKEEDYSFERDFTGYCQAAFDYVQSLQKIDSELPVSFWLKPVEVATLGAADAFDKALVLASLLIAGDCQNAKVRVLELEGGGRHPVVTLYFKEKQYLLDASQDASAFTFCGTLDEIFEKYSFDGHKVLKSAFEFNHEEYNEFE